jgi:G:T-mismatch repair DNA endonuclease (very short patch repair protein)
MGKLSDAAHWKRCITWTKKREPITCSNCGAVFIPIAGFEKRKKITTCSTECAKERFSQTLIARHASDKTLAATIGSKGGRESARKQIKRSKDEIALYDLCNAHFRSVRHNEEIVDGWDADIIIDDIQTAILWNGPWHYQDMPLSNHSLKQVQKRDEIKTSRLQNAGWNVIVYEDRYYTPEGAFKELTQTGGTE